MTADRLSFKEYLKTKEQLKQAIENTPQQTIEYSVRKYCKIPLGEDKDSKITINLKPKNKIIIEWLYDSIENPTPTKISFMDVKGINDIDEYDSYYTGSKLLKWLNTNTSPKTKII